MVKRKIIKINEKKCNGCGLCITGCPEGALKLVNGKAKLVKEFYCDGLGACIGSCPQDAIRIEERDAKAYDEKAVMKNIVKQGEDTVKAHLNHLKQHGEHKHLNDAVDFLEKKGIDNPLKTKTPHMCPGAAVRKIEPKSKNKDITQSSHLDQWPVQLTLLPPIAPFFENADLLVCADCVPFANANFHSKLLKGKALVVGCPKLDDIEAYQEKLTEIIKNNKIKSITVAIMEVPCCYGLHSAVEEALENSGKKIPLKQKIIGINGEIN